MLKSNLKEERLQNTHYFSEILNQNDTFSHYFMECKITPTTCGK